MNFKSKNVKHEHSKIKNSKILCPLDMKRILVIGGTGFPCANIVEKLWDRGHRICVFNRGNNSKRWEHYNPVISQIFGDRTDITTFFRFQHQIWLRNEMKIPFDTIIDSGNAFEPDSVQNIINVVGCDIPYYVFISSMVCSGPIEGTPPGLEIYRENKLECEERVKQFYGDKHLIARPSYLIGKNDNTDRFDYTNFPDKVLWKGSDKLVRHWNHVDVWVDALIKKIEKEDTGLWEQKFYDA